MEWKGVKVAVVGLAQSGLSAIELLASHGAAVIAVDVKPLEQLPAAGDLLSRWQVPFRLQSPEAFSDVDWIVLSPGVPPQLEVFHQARSRGVRLIGEVELASYFLEGEIIAITGSNGKTTTTALVGHILTACGIPAQVGGNIGTLPATGLVKSSRPDQWNVLEVSSFQLETIQNFRARIGVCLNLSPDHLDRHPSFEAYAQAKARLFETQTELDWAVLNRDDPVVAGFARRTKGRVFWFGLSSPGLSEACLDGEWLVLGGQRLLPAAQVPLKGRHNLENVLAASSAALLAGCSVSGIAAAIPSFRAVEHRLEYVTTIAGVHFYNDSKATNVDSALKAIEALDPPLWVILGGKDKGSDYAPLATALQPKARAALLIGAAAPLIARALEGKVPYVHCGTLAEAVRYAFDHASPGDTVVLAPACASFDQFQNFEHRGRVFKEEVARLAARAQAGKP